MNEMNADQWIMLLALSKLDKSLTLSLVWNFYTNSVAAFFLCISSNFSILYIWFFSSVQYIHKLVFSMCIYNIYFNTTAHRSERDAIKYIP